MQQKRLVFFDASSSRFFLLFTNDFSMLKIILKACSDSHFTKRDESPLSTSKIAHEIISKQ